MTEIRQEYFRCYYCTHFSTDEENEYLKHGAQNHLYKPLFPNQTDLERYNLRPQNKPWEKCKITEEEAEERLARWAEKRLKEENKRKEKGVEDKVTYITEQAGLHNQIGDLSMTQRDDN